MVCDAFFIAYCGEMVVVLLSMLGLSLWINESTGPERARKIRFQNRYLASMLILIVVTLTVAITCKVNNV